MFRQASAAEGDGLPPEIIVDYGEDGKLVSVEVLDSSLHAGHRLATTCGSGGAAPAAV